MLVGFLFGVCIANTVLLCAIGFYLYHFAIEVRSSQKSTHQIVMPTPIASDLFQTLDEETKQKMTKAPEEYDSIN